MEKAILYDSSKCTACRGCQVACKSWNEHEAEETTNRGSYENPKELSPETWVKMRFIETERNGKFAWLFARRACMHCTDASCTIVCPTGAILKTDEGFVHIDQEWCIGCGNCTQACPFDIPHKDHHHTGTAMKCTGCTSTGLNRQDAGLAPACVTTCPTGALKFGDRDQLIDEANQRIADLKAKGFSNAILYGKNELGGLHSMYILDDTAEVYGLPESPEVASSTVIQKWLTGIATAGIIAALPLWFVFKRRQELESRTKGGA
jgi:formate dehydrogenase iron-sulfur subunit